MRPVEELEDALGRRFLRRELIEQALTHSSHANEQKPRRSEDNERLEFLGDAVLGFLISDLLWSAKPGFREGELSKLRGFLVSSANLLRHAERLRLGEFLRLGKGEDKSGGRRKQALLVDAFEAVLAAMYLDGGLDPVRRLVIELFGPQIDQAAASGPRVSDFKSALQEHLQSRGWKPAEYRLIEVTGPDHEKLFVVEVCVGGAQVARGMGLTRKAAEQAGAMKALQSLGRSDNAADAARESGGNGREALY